MRTPPPLNELTNWLAARSCLVAVVALPLFGMSVLSGQTNDASLLSKMVPSIVEGLQPPGDGRGGTLTRPGGFGPSEDATTEWSRGADASEYCIVCQTEMTEGYVYWHRTLGPARPRTGHRVGHSEHGYWLRGPCFMIHWYCAFPLGAQELVREISDAVTARDVVALADYARMPSVSLLSERSAIQVQGCDGDTIAGQIPVNPELLAAIEAAAAPLQSGG